MKGIPLYISPGVTNLKFINSEITGKTVSVAIYLDAESARNTVKGNNIDISTKRELVAIDGSSNNKIVNNRFSNLRLGGIFLYKNCGEGGVIRHSTPSHNEIVNNIFYYDTYQGYKPSVYLGSRNGGRRYCGLDSGYPFGSSVSNKDYARYNVVMQNQIYKRSAYEMIKTKRPFVNSPNYIANNETVTKETVDKDRLAGCYVEIEGRGFILHGEAFNVSVSQCRGDKYTCDNGDLIKEPLYINRTRSGLPDLCAPEYPRSIVPYSGNSTVSSPREDVPEEKEQTPIKEVASAGDKAVETFTPNWSGFSLRSFKFP